MRKNLGPSILFVILFVGFNSLAKGQTTDYVITNEGDTLRGSIEDRGELNNAKQIRFVQVNQTNVQNLTPSKVQAFYIDETGYYQSFEIKENNQVVSYFFKKLVTGDTELFMIAVRNPEGIATNLNSLGNAVFEFFFLRKGDEKLVSLDPAALSNSLKKNLKMCDSARFVNLVNDGNIKKKELVDIVIEYNICTNTKIDSYLVDESLKSGFKGDVFYGAKLSFNRTDFIYSNISTVAPNYNYQKYNSYGISLFYRKELRESIDLNIELSYLELGYDGQKEFIVNEFYDNAGERILLESNGSLKVLQIPVGISYRSNLSNISILGDFGVSLGFAFDYQHYNEKVIFVQENGNDLQIKEMVTDFNYYTPTTETAIFTGIGSIIPLSSIDLHLGIRYKKGAFSKKADDRNNTLSTYIGFGFNK